MRQRSITLGQRGWKWHPDGGFSGLGTSPLSTISSRLSAGCEGSAAANSARVYGWRAALATVDAAPISTTRPRYITAIVWLMCATAARSCAMKR